MIAILDALAGMIHALVYALPAGLLPFVGITLTVVTGVLMLLTLLYFLQFNNWIGGLIFLALASSLWLMTPSVTEEVHQRQLAAVTAGSEAAQAPVNRSGGADERAPLPAGQPL